MTRAAWLGWQLQHSLCFASDVCDLEQYQKTRVVPAVDPGSVYWTVLSHCSRIQRKSLPFFHSKRVTVSSQSGCFNAAVWAIHSQFCAADHFLSSASSRFSEELKGTQDCFRECAHQAQNLCDSLPRRYPSDLNWCFTVSWSDPVWWLVGLNRPD